VTTFAFSGDAFNWWFNWKQGNQNITWEKFERDFIKQFIPELWEMMEAAEGEEHNATATMMLAGSEHNDESMTESEKTEGYSTEVSDCHSDINSSEFDRDLTDLADLNTSISTVSYPKASNRNPHEVAKEKQVACDPTVVPPPPPNSVHPLIVIPRQESPAKPPDRSVALDMGGYARADAERRRTQMNFLRPPPSPEPPDADRVATALPWRASLHKSSYLNRGVHENLRIIGAVNAEKVLEKLRAKWTICDFNIFLNLLGQIHRSLPSILHSYDLLHVLSSGQHTFPFLFHVSPIGYPLPPTSTTCHVYTKQLKVSKIIEIECDLSEFHNQMGQAHISLLNYFLASVAKIFHN
jgi:hypothetical protein